MKKIIWTIFTILSASWFAFSAKIVIDARTAGPSGHFAGGLLVALFLLCIFALYLLLSAILFVIYGIKTKSWRPLIVLLSITAVATGFLLIYL